MYVCNECVCMYVMSGKARMYEADSVWHQVVMANSFGEEGRGLM